jgi:asparagine synthase (glutamine-hydrolysing)
VALSGDVADELFGSYLSHRLAQPMYDFARLQDKVKANNLTKNEISLFKPFDTDFLDKLFKKSEGSEAKWRYQISLFLDEEKDVLFTDRFKSEYGKISSLDIFETQFKSLTSDDPLNRMLEMEWNTQLPDQVLAFVDFLSMAHSVEIRSPFLDYRLVEFAATIPGSFKIRNGNVKDIFKMSIEHILPEGITKRPKEGFVLPIFNWIEEQLEGYCRDTLSKGRLERHGLFNWEMISGILDDYYKGNRGNAAKIWNLMMFQVWWERYFG